VWFREGLAQYLDPSNRAAAAAAFPADSALRQTADPAEARRAYADSLAAVTRLVERYGEGIVLGSVEKWGQTPFSSRVTNASPSQPAANSK
jgi:hypothetical protein